MQGVITRFTNGATSMPSLMNWFFFFFLGCVEIINIDFKKLLNSILADK